MRGGESFPEEHLVILDSCCSSLTLEHMSEDGSGGGIGGKRKAYKGKTYTKICVITKSPKKNYNYTQTRKISCPL